MPTDMEKALFKAQQAFHLAGLDMILAYGTCLGAVREKKLISYDRDMDVYMIAEPKKSYPKLCDAVRSLGGQFSYSLLFNIDDTPEGVPHMQEEEFAGSGKIARLANIVFPGPFVVDIFFCYPNKSC
jgi:hypothetical protein